MYCQVFFAVKCVKLLRSKVCVLSKVFFDAKCASAYVILNFIFFGKFSHFYYLLNTFRATRIKRKLKLSVSPDHFFIVGSYNNSTVQQNFNIFNQ